jgi:hypothetical protein
MNVLESDTPRGREKNSQAYLTRNEQRGVDEGRRDHDV